MGTRKEDHRSTGNETEKRDRARMRAMGLALQLSSTVVGSLLFFLIGGILLDRRLGTQPLFLFIGLLLAFIAIGYSLYELATIGVKRGPRPAAKPAQRTPPRRSRSWDDDDYDDSEDDDQDWPVGKGRQREE